MAFHITLNATQFAQQLFQINYLKYWSSWACVGVCGRVWDVDSLEEEPVIWKMFQRHDVIMR